MSVLFLTLELCIAQQPRTVPVKVLNSGPDNTCPSESQVTSARNELINSFINFGLTEDNPATSCSILPANNPSGYYWISTRGSPVRVYCNMDATSGDLTGGWMRVAYIDMRNTSHQCPSGLTLFSRSSPPRRVCNVTRSGGCVSTTFTVHGVEYSHVYGRIIGYQNRSPIGFNAPNDGFEIDDPYVQGVSLTHGQNPRKHIWTFAGVGGAYFPSYWSCPCFNINSSTCSRLCW